MVGLKGTKNVLEVEDMSSKKSTKKNNSYGTFVNGSKNVKMGQIFKT